MSQRKLRDRSLRGLARFDISLSESEGLDEAPACGLVGKPLKPSPKDLAPPARRALRAGTSTSYVFACSSKPPPGLALPTPGVVLPLSASFVAPTTHI
jgi:hypothetical protein